MTLKAKDFELSTKSGENETWIGVTLALKDKVYSLGSDVDYIIIPRLIDTLNKKKPLEDSMVAEEMEEYNALNLAGKHTRIYAQHTPDYLHLIFVDVDGHVFEKLKLFPEDLQEWLTTLKKYQKRYLGTTKDGYLHYVIEKITFGIFK